MRAIYKRELRGYLTSMIGYLYIFFVLLLTGVYFSAYQLSALYPKFEYTISSLVFVFLIGVPFLTMRILAEERKQKTDQMLLTAPISVKKIVYGKYFALVTVYMIPIGIMCLYPFIIAKFGEISYRTAYCAVLGFFLLGCANLSIGVFISALTESQVIAAVLTFVLLFSFFMISGISSFFSQTGASTAMTFACLIVALALILYTMIRNVMISVIVGIFGEGILGVLYMIKPSLFEGGIQKVLEIFNIAGHFDNFANGILDLKGVVYFLSVIAVCLFLTEQSILKRRWK